MHPAIIIITGTVQSLWLWGRYRILQNVLLVSFCDVLNYKSVSHVHIGGDTVEINIEAAGSDITEYTLTNDKTSAGMFGFLYCYIVCINLILLYVCKAITFYSCSSFHFLTPSSEVIEQNSAEHWYMFGVTRISKC